MNVSNSKKIITNSDILKLIAIIAMLIDHVGYGFIPNGHIFRIIGRIAMPIFSYQIAQGFFHTSNLKKYMIRMWVFALITQVPYTLYFDTTRLNILFAFLLSLFLMDRIEKKEYYWIPTILFLSILVPMDYYGLAVILPLMFYLCRKNKLLSLLVQSVILIVFAIIVSYVFKLPYWMYIQSFAVLGSFIALYLPVEKIKIRLSKYLFYWFYPVHLAVLFAIKWIIIFEVL